MLQVCGIKGWHSKIERRPKLLDKWEARRWARTMLIQYRRGADPEWKRKVIAKSIRKKQFGLGVKHIILPNAQRFNAKPLTGNDHITMAMNCRFRLPGGAG